MPRSHGSAEPVGSVPASNEVARRQSGLAASAGLASWLSALLMGLRAEVAPSLCALLLATAALAGLAGRALGRGQLTLLAQPYRCATGYGLRLHLRRTAGPAPSIAVGLFVGGRGIGAAAMFGASGPVPPLTDLLGLPEDVPRHPRDRS